MSDRRLFLLDFDRTIFDTKRFSTDIMHALQAKYSLDPIEFERTYTDYFDPETGGYDPHAHHNKLLGITPDELDSVVSHSLSGRDYRFPDAASWMDDRDYSRDDCVIITMGRPRYQALKFAHCSGIVHIEKIVMPRNKGIAVRNHLHHIPQTPDLSILDGEYEQILLIDDSADTFTALGDEPKITGIRLCRAGEKYSQIPSPPHVRQINSFGDLT